MKGTIISISPHIVKVERFEEPIMSNHWFNYVSWEKEWDTWQELNSANWELPVHEESLKRYGVKPTPLRSNYTNDGAGELGFKTAMVLHHEPFVPNQPVTIKEIKNGKAILL